MPYEQVRLLVLLIALAVPFSTFAQVDPCHGQYTHLNTADRAQSFDDQSILLCDRDDLDPGWYRISGPAGDRMPEECVPDSHCGTHASGWLDGTHPSIADGTVIRRVCYNWASACCNWQNNIQVRNCGAFYLYQLVKPPSCSLRYCGNGGVDPCRGQYTHLNTADRAQSFDDQSILLCDKNDLDPGWYRISGPAGDRMPEECVPDSHCGTHASGWLDGTHPSVADGTVIRRVCYNWASACCNWQNNIQVRNCGAFYLYQLVKPPSCSLRYCGNGGVDPCRGQYTHLNTADRAQSFDDQSILLCDKNDLDPGWYRISGPAGDRMPEECVPDSHCGTHASGWLDGTHPSVADGTVIRRVCYNWASACCNWQNNIQVRNCGAFYLYQLVKPPSCSLRYCGNGGVDPCRGQYTHLNTADRAQSFDDQSILLCDKNDLDPGWYRISGPAGDRMPEECVPDSHCGTHASGWLDGTHPSVADGTVIRRVCYNWASACCNWQNNIQVRNCGAFYLYQLVKPPSCSLRYCGNGGENDPWTMWSTWSSCSATCGGGMQSRSRSCTNPPAGAGCQGSNYETQNCNTESCPGCVEGSLVTDVCGLECTCSGGQLRDCTRVRREFTSMTRAERELYTRTVLTASTDPRFKPEYDRLLEQHETLFNSGIHTRDQFLPWHRWYILQYENLLREVECTFTVAYWDWSVVSQDPWRTGASDLWFDGDSGFGGNGVPPTRCVTTGPFGEDVWSLPPAADNGCLTRDFNGNTPDAVAVAEVLATAVAGFNQFEFNLRRNLHDSVHCRIATGGRTMCSGDAATAPEFFLHHSFIDKIWLDWQAKSSDHLNAHFPTVSGNMIGTNGVHASQVLDSSRLPQNVRVRYQGPVNAQLGNVLQRLRSMPLRELREIPRGSFSLLTQDAIEMFNIPAWEVEEARRLGEELQRFTGHLLPVKEFPEPGSLEESLGFSLDSIAR